jgi:hypothetical protein
MLRGVRNMTAKALFADKLRLEQSEVRRDEWRDSAKGRRVAVPRAQPARSEANRCYSDDRLVGWHQGPRDVVRRGSQPSSRS